MRLVLVSHYVDLGLFGVVGIGIGIGIRRYWFFLFFLYCGIIGLGCLSFLFFVCSCCRVIFFNFGLRHRCCALLSIIINFSGLRVRGRLSMIVLDALSFGVMHVIVMGLGVNSHVLIVLRGIWHGGLSKGLLFKFLLGTLSLNFFTNWRRRGNCGRNRRHWLSMMILLRLLYASNATNVKAIHR